MNPTPQSKVVVKTALLSAVFTVVLFMLVSYYFNHSLNPFIITQSRTQPLTVQGTGTITATPDQSQVNFTVTKTTPTAEVAQSQTNEAINKIVADLQKLGVDKNDIQTSNYDSSPNYNDSGDVILNYTVSEDVTVTLHDTAKANATIDTATKDGAQDVSGPSLTFSDAKQQDLLNQARVKAVADARQKAQSIANAAGVHLGKLLSINENTTPYPYPIRPLPMMGTTQGTNNSVPTQINPGQNSVTATVSLSYETY